MRRGRALAALIACSVLSGCGLREVLPHPSQAGPGDQAPRLQLPDLEGGAPLDLRSRAGKALVINFWASWCGPCRAEQPALNESERVNRARGVAYLGVDWRDDRAAARAFRSEFKVVYPSMFDEAGQALAGFNIDYIPATVLVGPDKRIRVRHLGQISAAELERLLGSLT